MTFFEHQARARQHTTQLVLLFLAAVVAVTLAVNLVVASVYAWTVGRFPFPTFDGAGHVALAYAAVPRAVYVWTTIGTLAIILIRSLHSMQSLRAGGDVVAVMVGGRFVARGTADPDERRLLNVVDEMAIASGVTVPRVYVLSGEPGINAFAAGYAPNQAAIVVTEGTLRQLTRDELQGVIAHEFSHVLNGDMRLNVRMIGVLAGILFVGEIGGFILRSSSSDRGGSRDRSSGAVLAAGIALLVIGYTGLLFGRLIKAAVARQREFLADASAVQFTRNPDGIAGALAVIGGVDAGSLVRHRRAETLSHMFFASGVAVWFESVFATHPPIPERIQRVHPTFFAQRYFDARGRAGVPAEAPVEVAGTSTTPAVGSEIAAVMAAADARLAARQEAAASPPSPAARPAPALPAGTPPPRAPRGRPAPPPTRHAVAAVLASVGQPAARHVDYAARLLDSLPPAVRDALGTPTGAQAAILALALIPEDPGRKRQMALLAGDGAGAEALARETERIAGSIQALPPALRLPVVALALPAVRALDQTARDTLLRHLQRLVEADQRVTLAEFVLLTIVHQHVRPDAGRAVPVRYRSIVEVAGDARLVLSLLAHAGAGDTGSAYTRGIGVLGIPEQPPVPLEQIAFPRVTEALERLRCVAPFVKRLMLAACVETVMADDRIALAEAELLRAVAAALDCPVPPILSSEGA